MARVVLDNVSKSYGDASIVKNVSIDIPDKEFFILVGPSGCGKSTTLRMIAGLEDITAGKISIDGRVVNDLPPKDRDIAMVFQNYALYPNMTVYENMAFGLKLRKVPKGEIDARVREAAKILNLQDGLLERKPKALSGGQRQRVAVGRAIVRKPQVFLFDEPLSNLDAKLRVEMRIHLKHMHERLQTTMIYVTHDQIEAMTMGSRICVMHDGMVQQVAAPLDLYHKPVNMFVAGFIGSPPMNFINVRLESQRDAVLLKHAAFTLVLPKAMGEKVRGHIGRDVVFGIRPEDLYDRLFYSYKIQEGQTIKAIVDIVEPMGSEIFLYLKAGEANFVVRVPAYVKAESHHPMELVVNLERIHLFDKETGATLLSDMPRPIGLPAPAAV